jgi:hypothetical protein
LASSAVGARQGPLDCGCWRSDERRTVAREDDLGVEVSEPTQRVERLVGVVVEHVWHRAEDRPAPEEIGQAASIKVTAEPSTRICQFVPAPST